MGWKQRFWKLLLHFQVFYLFNLRNVGIIFPVQSKYYGENILIKKILSSLTGIEKFALLNRRQTNIKSAVKYLTQSILSFNPGFNGILSLEEEEKVLKKLDEKFQQSKEHH